MQKNVKIANIELTEFPLLLAPMEDVSDPPFRALCKEQGCDMLYTEFISVEGLIRDAHKSLQKLDIYEEERPIGVQIFGAELESMMKAAEIVENAKPELLDINYGCPVQKVVCKLAGAGILKDIPKMISLTEAVVKSTNLPVTVKTRLGWDENTIFIEEVAERLQDIGIKALSIHARTRSQMYKGHSDWSWISKVKHYVATGELLAPPTIQERVAAAKSHLTNSIKWKGEKLGIVEMRRHYTNYFKGIPNVKEYRMQLVTESNPSVLFELLDDMQENYSHEIFELVS